MQQSLETRFLWVYLGVSMIGVGSAMFHGTLSHVGQQGDETPMVWTILSWLYCLVCMDPDFERRRPLVSARLAVVVMVGRNSRRSCLADR